MKILLTLMLFVFSTACATSTQYTKVNPADISANGDAIAVIDAHGCALTFFFHLAQPWEEGTLKHVIIKELVTGRSNGGNKVELLNANES